MGTNNKSELTAGFQRVLLTSIIKQNLMHLMAPFPTNCYLSIMSTTKKLMTTTSEADRMGY